MSAGQGPVGGSMSAAEIRARIGAEPSAVDWPARFRAAADAAEAGDPIPMPATACVLRQLAEVADPRATWRQTVETIGRALLGQDGGTGR